MQFDTTTRTVNRPAEPIWIIPRCRDEMAFQGKVFSSTTTAKRKSGMYQSCPKSTQIACTKTMRYFNSIWPHYRCDAARRIAMVFDIAVAGVSMSCTTWRVNASRTHAVPCGGLLAKSAPNVDDGVGVAASRRRKQAYIPRVTCLSCVRPGAVAVAVTHTQTCTRIGILTTHENNWITDDACACANSLYIETPRVCVRVCLRTLRAYREQKCAAMPSSKQHLWVCCMRCTLA